jgi:hypothetical protein
MCLNRYIKFDTFTPAVEKGLPVTRVISRMTLQQILAKAVGQEIIENSSNVVDFGDDGTKVCTRNLKKHVLLIILIQFFMDSLMKK